ncbi:hypothetical protein AX16_004228 [Volvariella volvacea WC 439]|nr:hypothetical protein AX16_004228 [Volvariella volvacea WC 439]
MSTVTTTLQANPTSFPATGTPPHPPLPIGAIVGGVCAGALLAVAATVGWIYWGRVIDRDVAKHRQEAEALKKKRLSSTTPPPPPPATNPDPNPSAATPSPNPVPSDPPHYEPPTRTRTRSQSSTKKTVKFAEQDVTLGPQQGTSRSITSPTPTALVRPPPAMRSRSSSLDGTATSNTGQLANGQWTKFNSSTSSLRNAHPVPPVPTLNDAELGVAKPQFAAALPSPPQSTNPVRNLNQGHGHTKASQAPPMQTSHHPLHKSSKSSNLSLGSSSVYSTASGEERQTRVPSSLILAALGGKKTGQEALEAQDRESGGNWRMSWTRSGFAWREDRSRRLVGQGSYASIGSNNSSTVDGTGRAVQVGVAL